MLLSEQLKSLTIIGLQTGGPIGHISEPIIDTARLEIAALSCHNLYKQKLVLQPRDIIRHTKKYLLVNSEQDLIEAGEIVRLAPLLEKPLHLVNLPVYSESGQKLGRVEDYATDLDSYLIRKIYVKNAPWRNIRLRRLSIDRRQIIEVSPKKIIVAEGSQKAPILGAQPVKQ